MKPTALAVALSLALLLTLAACGDSEPTVTINGRPVKVPAGTSAFNQAFGEKMREAAEKARAFSERGLVAADVQRYLELSPKWRELAGNPGATEKMLSENGMAVLEWASLQGRIMTLMASIKMDAVSEKLKADAEVVRPFMPQIEAALKPPPR